MLYMSFYHLPELGAVRLRLYTFHLYQLLIQVSVQTVFFVQHIRGAAAHARSEVLPYGPQHDHETARHILASVFADALHYAGSAGIPDAESLAGHSCDVGLTGCCPVQGHIADDDVFPRIISGILRRTEHQLPAGQSLTEIVVGVSREIKRQPSGYECAEALPSGPGTLYANGVVGKALRMAPGNLFSQQRTKRPVRVADLDKDLRLFSRLDRSLDIRRGDQDSLIFGALKPEIVPASGMEEGLFPVCFRHIQQDAGPAGYPRGPGVSVFPRDLP